MSLLVEGTILSKNPGRGQNSRDEVVASRSRPSRYTGSAVQESMHPWPTNALNTFGACTSPAPWVWSRTHRRLTPRSSGAPTAWRAGHQALGLRPILRLLSSVPCRRRPLSSNVRQHSQTPLRYSEEVRLSACTKQPGERQSRSKHSSCTIPNQRPSHEEMNS
jgi:hypothetical protein